MNRTARLDTDLLIVESFATTAAAAAYSLEAGGTWNDATAGCCRPRTTEPVEPVQSNSFCSFLVYCQ